MGLKPITVLYVTRFITSLGYFCLFPILAIVLLEKPFLFQPGQIALLLVLLAMWERGMSLFALPMIRRVPVKTLLLYSHLVIAACLTTLFFSRDFFWYCLLFSLFGFALAAHNLTVRLWIADYGNDQERVRIFGQLYRFMNAAAGVGPVIAFSIAYQEYGIYFFLVAAFFYGISAVLFLVSFRDGMILNVTGFEIANFKSGISNFLSSHRPVFFYLLILFLFTFFFHQVDLLPIYFKTHSSIPKYFGWALALNPVLVTIGQGWATQVFMRMENRRTFSGVLAGFVCMFIAFCIFAFHPSEYRVFFFMFFVTLGEMLVFPHIDFLIGKRAIAKFRPVFFGLSGMVYAFGRMTAHGPGTYAVGNALHSTAERVWWYGNIFLLALFMGLGFLLCKKDDKLIRALSREEET